MYPTPGSFVHIQSYKHDGSLHRTWCKGFVLEADEKHIVVNDTSCGHLLLR